MQPQTEAQAPSLVGTWIVTFSPEMPPQDPPIKIMNIATFGCGSVMTVAGTTHLLNIPPLAELGDEHGSSGGEWVCIHGSDFRYTYVSLIYKNGLASGTQMESVEVTIDNTGTEFNGNSTVEFRDMAGNIVFAGHATATAVRLVDFNPQMRTK